MIKNKRTMLAALMMAGVASLNAAKAEEGPSDMQIAHIAYTAGVLDISYAELALAKSENPKVRTFAELMLRDHAAVNDQALALLAKLGAEPEDNATSRQLVVDAKAKRDELSALEGKAFDLAYAENELGYHQFVNDTLETSFIPAADNKEFKELLKSALAVFEVHEGHAGEMVKSLK